MIARCRATHRRKHRPWIATLSFLKNAFFSWRRLPTMLQPRACFAIVWTPDGRLFAIGGNTTATDQTATVETLHCSNFDTEEPISTTWMYAAPLPSARASHAAAFICGKIIVMGGTNKCCVDCYTLPTSGNPEGQWTMLHPLPEPLEMIALIPVENVLIGVCTSLIIFRIVFSSLYMRLNSTTYLKMLQIARREWKILAWATRKLIQRQII